MLVFRYDVVLGQTYWLRKIKKNRAEKRAYNGKKFTDFVLKQK